MTKQHIDAILCSKYFTDTQNRGMRNIKCPPNNSRQHINQNGLLSRPYKVRFGRNILHISKQIRLYFVSSIVPQNIKMAEGHFYSISNIIRNIYCEETIFLYFVRVLEPARFRFKYLQYSNCEIAVILQLFGWKYLDLKRVGRDGMGTEYKNGVSSPKIFLILLEME